MQRIWTLTLLIALLATAGAGYAATSSADTNTDSNYSHRPEAAKIIKALTAQGLNPQWVSYQLAHATRQESILKAMSAPAEKRLTWGSYRAIFLNKKRIRLGAAFWKAHAKTLARADKEYGVPPQIILAILGVETYYGQNMGDYRVLDALATLGFDYPPRASFFLKQLEAFFVLSQKAHISVSEATGSYAGAMGMAQFIPTSYLAYAVDFDHDGKIDLINSADDAIGSIANYFAEHHWQKGLPVAAQATVTGDNWQAAFTTAQLKPAMTLTTAKQAGITALACSGQHVPSAYCFDKLPAATPVAALELAGAYGKEYWLTTNNFYTITRYNHSPLYAMAVFQLATHIKAAFEETQ